MVILGLLVVVFLLVCAGLIALVTWLVRRS
jgi:hypothetical protein